MSDTSVDSVSREPRPNVLLICTDQWPGSLLGCAGNPAVLTPTLDQLSDNGVRFINAYSECPVCIPARRTLMTGLKPHSHGLLTLTEGILRNSGERTMPAVPTLAQTFRDHGYHAVAVGKLHVWPQRSRLGFDEVLLEEEGRGVEGARADDYELFLADRGYAGARFAHGMCNNNYMWRPWHLPEETHVTNWAAREMSRQIIRRDPQKPGFWYLSFSHPHPPLEPLQAYLDVYRDVDIPDPYTGEWARGSSEALPTPIHNDLVGARNQRRVFTPQQTRAIRRAFYAMCTHIDHQIRVVLGTLREEGILDNTIICFTADHGDMLGNHGLWAKHWMYEDSACVPMILSGTRRQSEDGTVGHHRIDDRLVGLSDLMPTLLELAGIEPPQHCEGLSMVGPQRHDHLYGAWGACDGHAPTRMIRSGRYKLVYYARGNHLQLFDMEEDRRELNNLAGDSRYTGILEDMKQRLVAELCSEEMVWVSEDKLVGDSDAPRAEPKPHRSFSQQRGIHFPTPRVKD